AGRAVSRWRTAACPVHSPSATPTTAAPARCARRSSTPTPRPTAAAQTGSPSWARTNTPSTWPSCNPEIDPRSERLGHVRGEPPRPCRGGPRSPSRRYIMFRRSWLSWPRRPHGSQVQSALRARPRLEQLEDRVTPAIFHVTTTADEVTPGGGVSLREAIIAANTNPGPDTIVLPAGTFNLSIFGANEDAAATGD